MPQRDSRTLISAAWRLVIEQGMPRVAAARELGITEQRVDRIINAIAERRRPAAAPPPEDDKPCVVLLEDDPLAAEMTEKVLRDCGADADFVHAMDMDQYLDVLEHRPVEVVISDSSVINLSPLSAAQVAKQLHPAVGFIILSGHVDPAQAEKARAAGILMTAHKSDVKSIVPLVLKILSAASAKPWLS